MGRLIPQDQSSQGCAKPTTQKKDGKSHRITGDGVLLPCSSGRACRTRRAYRGNCPGCRPRACSLRGRTPCCRHSPLPTANPAVSSPSTRGSSRSLKRDQGQRQSFPWCRSSLCGPVGLWLLEVRAHQFLSMRQLRGTWPSRDCESYNVGPAFRSTPSHGPICFARHSFETGSPPQSTRGKDD
jgi:hypothetical protein